LGEANLKFEDMAPESWLNRMQGSGELRLLKDFQAHELPCWVDDAASSIKAWA
jgi:hypothetical protein